MGHMSAQETESIPLTESLRVLSRLSDMQAKPYNIRPHSLLSQ